MARSIKLTKQEVAARWLYGVDYSRTVLDPRAFYKALAPDRKRDVAVFLQDLAGATDV